MVKNGPVIKEALQLFSLFEDLNNSYYGHHADTSRSLLSLRNLPNQESTIIIKKAKETKKGDGNRKWVETTAGK